AGCPPAARYPGDGRGDLFQACPEDRDIAPLGEFDNESVLASFPFVIPLQAAAQFSGLHADDGIDAWVEGLAPSEQVRAQQGFLETARITFDGFFYGVGKKAAQALGMNKLFAGEDLVYVDADCP